MVNISCSQCGKFTSYESETSLLKKSEKIGMVTHHLEVRTPKLKLVYFRGINMYFIKFRGISSDVEIGAC